VIFWEVASLFFALLCLGPWLLRCGSLFYFRFLLERGDVGFERSVFLFLRFDWHTYLGFLFSAFFFSFVALLVRIRSSVPYGPFGPVLTLDRTGSQVTIQSSGKTRTGSLFGTAAWTACSRLQSTMSTVVCSRPRSMAIDGSQPSYWAISVVDFLQILYMTAIPPSHHSIIPLSRSPGPLLLRSPTLLFSFLKLRFGQCLEHFIKLL
jgi:hypothetical protein